MDQEAKLAEVWRPIVGYEGLYEISNMGRVKSMPRPTLINKCTDRSRTLTERLLGPSMTRAGTLVIHLSKEGKGKTFNLHLLVARHFLPGEPGAQVRFKNGIRRDCRASNLMWNRQTHGDFPTAVRESA